MWLRWLPWRFIVSRVARSRGFIDPVVVIARLGRFAQPSEVAEPIELLRAGLIFHARGLINTRAIQHNLDWVWPYWIQRQFDPADESFIPRAFSITHVNLTHRNWTAVGLPGHDELPIVDPRGLLTPLFDGWSIDIWIVPDDGEPLLPSRLRDGVEQELLLRPGPAVRTRARAGGLALSWTADAHLLNGAPYCRLHAEAAADRPGWLVVSLRPANPEGISFIHDLEARDAGRLWIVNARDRVELDRTPDAVRLSEYRRGDVFTHLIADEKPGRMLCDVGLATGAAMFRIPPGASRTLEVRIPLGRPPPAIGGCQTWPDELRGLCSVSIPDARMQSLYDAAVRTLILHSPHEVYPGPYTYKRFWFRDAAFILSAMLAVGMHRRALGVIETFPSRQTRAGYFLSQEGEWDSNGEAIWAIARYRALSGRPPPTDLLRAVRKGAHWIIRKRLPVSGPSGREPVHAGLLPAGFSAEHLGPNDYYYWDDFWGVAGLLAAAELLPGDPAAPEFRAQAASLLGAVDRSIERSAPRRRHPGIPASPYRRMDAGAIGSIVAGYPLALWDARDPRLLQTAEFLMGDCFVRGGFFQDMIHSGINPYLTLHVAQVLLRAGDRRALQLMRTVRDLASPTGQWPEAIHPHTLGGCMGDGQHVWAAAEWIMMLRNCFILEERVDGESGLVLGAGLDPDWLDGPDPLSFGPAATPFGDLTVRALRRAGTLRVEWDAAWRAQPPHIRVHLPGQPPRQAEPGASFVEIDGVPVGGSGTEGARAARGARGARGAARGAGP